jgi:hypothetical protein
MCPLVVGISYPISSGAVYSAAFSDNISSPTTLIYYAWASAKNVQLQYSVIRTTAGGTNDETGRLLISTDGTNVNITRDSEYTNDTGLVFSATVDATNVYLQYTSTSTGYGGTFYYSKLVLD